MQIEQRWKKFHLITGKSEIRTPSNLEEKNEPQFIIYVIFANCFEGDTIFDASNKAIACFCGVKEARLSQQFSKTLLRHQKHSAQNFRRSG